PPAQPAAPPPTAARPQTSDPDAPITTRPQPLD
ncbi:MAG: class F sortase, partial [Caulobacteraceae bacterium]|nr:class F sortase [Caulobacteraceae bacterium]